MRRPATFLCLALAAAACAAGTTGRTASQTVDASYAQGGGVFGTGAQVTIRARTFEDQGKVGVCAAWTADGIDTTAAQYLPFVLGTGVLQLDGHNVMQGFDRFPRVPTTAALDGAQAGCVRTGADWRPGYAGAAPRIRFARLALGADPEEGLDTTFREL